MGAVKSIQFNNDNAEESGPYGMSNSMPIPTLENA